MSKGKQETPLMKMEGPWMTALIVLGVIAVMVVFFFFVTGKARATTQVTICHATSSQQNPYQKLTVDWNAVDGSGGGDHNTSGHQNGNDIIPPGFWDFNGRNWTTQGQATWNNNCNVPQPTPIPSPTSVPPTPTPVPPTPTPQVDVCPNIAGNQSETPKYMTNTEGYCDCEKGYHREYEEEEYLEKPGDNDYFYCEANEPEPTPEPTRTPEQPLTPAQAGGAPVCTDLNTILLPQNPHVLRAGAIATVKWNKTQADQVNIYYTEGEHKSLPISWTHSVRDEQNDGYVVIGGLNPSLAYTFGLQQKAGCGGGPIVVTPDGLITKLFRAMFYYWQQ